ncbi:MAG: hypothetical protein ACP5P3_10590 [Ignavibacteria bacterium]
MKKLIFAIAVVLISLFAFFSTPTTTHAEGDYAYVIETYEAPYWVYTYYSADGGIIRVVYTDRRY